MISVPLPALLTDAVVDCDIDLRIELKSEAIARGERVTLLAPRMAPSLTSQYWALQSRHRPKGGEGRLNNNTRGRGWVGEEMV
jgi:hypothetical protein